MKQNQKKQSGFTLVELMVVLTIMILVFSIILVSFNRQRAARSVLEAQNEMVTNIRKAQGYILSARNYSTNTPAKYYLLTFTPPLDYYTISAISNQGAFQDVETIKLRNGVNLNSVDINNEGTVDAVCMQVIFSAPFGKTYIYTSNDVCDDSIVPILADPVQLDKLDDRSATITLFNSKGGLKSVDIEGLTGKITAP